MKKIKMYFYIFLIKLLKKIIISYTTSDVGSIQDVLERKVFNSLPVDINTITYTTVNSSLDKLVFVITFIDGNNMEISIQIIQDRIRLFLENTTIKDYFLLSDILEKTQISFRIYETEICGYFQILIKQIIDSKINEILDV